MATACGICGREAETLYEVTAYTGTHLECPGCFLGVEDDDIRDALARPSYYTNRRKTLGYLVVEDGEINDLHPNAREYRLVWLIEKLLGHVVVEEDPEENEAVHEAIEEALRQEEKLAELLGDYADRWVAVRQHNVIASAATFGELLDQVRDMSVEGCFKVPPAGTGAAFFPLIAAEGQPA